MATIHLNKFRKKKPLLNVNWSSKSKGSNHHENTNSGHSRIPELAQRSANHKDNLMQKLIFKIPTNNENGLPY